MIYAIREDMLKQHGTHDEYYILKDFSNELDDGYIDTLLRYNEKRDVDRSSKVEATYTFFKVDVDIGHYSMEINKTDITDIIVMDL